MDKKINLCGIENCKYNKNKICCLTRDPSVCFTNLCEIAKRDKQIADLQSQLSLAEKALELACEMFKEYIDIDDNIEKVKVYFKIKAKEMKSE